MSDDDLDLRAALGRARPRGMNDDLAGPAIRRGRQVQRRRTAIGAGVGVIAVVGAIVAVATLPGQRRDVILATPSPVVSTAAHTATPSPTPASPSTQPTSTRPTSSRPTSTGPTSTGPTAKQPGGVPGLWGTFTRPLTLLHDGVGAQGDASAWATHDDPLLRCDPEAKPVLTGLLASRAIASTVPEGAASETILEFADEQDAVAFLTSAAADLTACQDPGQQPMRTRTVASERPGTGWDSGVALRSWSQQQVGTTWVDAPGATLQIWVRKGTLVTGASVDGEYVGDPLRNPGAEAEVMRGITHVTARW